MPSARGDWDCWRRGGTVIHFLGLGGSGRREDRSSFSNKKTGAQQGRMNEFFSHRALCEKWKLSLSNSVHQGPHWGVSPRCSAYAWHVNMQSVSAGLSSRRRRVSGKETQPHIPHEVPAQALMIMIITGMCAVTRPSEHILMHFSFDLRQITQTGSMHLKGHPVEQHTG